MEFKDKFIGFIDILGFKQLVKAAESGTGIPLKELLAMLKEFGSTEQRTKFEKYGPTTCPQAKHHQRDLDFRITQISDCTIVSSEVSPAGVINLINHCGGSIVGLMVKGIMCRGYITRGLVYHTEDQVIGSGYQMAYENEANVDAFKRTADERGTPFVEIDPVVCNYVKNCGDSCVKEMFSRHVKDDGDVVALFPFKMLAHSFMIAGFGHWFFDAEKEKKANQNMRLSLEQLKERVMAFVDKSNPSAVKKADYYVQALNAQSALCDNIDDLIEKLNSSFPPNPPSPGQI